MIQVYKHSNGHLEDNISLASAEKGSWIHVVNPDSEDLQLVSMVTEIPTDVLKTALDTEERSHVEIEDNYIFVVINIPIILETDSYDTLPMGIFITPDFIITLCIQETEVMRAFTENKYPLFYTFKKTRFLFQILYRSATLFLRYLMQINRRTDDIEEILRHSMRNKEFFLLLELQKSLTYFTSALRSNGIVMERLMRLRRNTSLHHLIKMYEEDEETGKIIFTHNPFSMPQGGLDALKNKNPLDILAYQYDLVCNGIELSSGAVRNHDPEIMLKAFEIAGYTEEDILNKFSALYNSFKFGAPAHAGMAPGVDRMIMLLLDEENIREIIAFPMNSNAQDVMLGSPSEVSEMQLREVHIKVRK